VLDDLLGELFGEAVFGRLSRSRRAQLLLRMFFGLLGAGLGIAGAVHFARRPGVTSNTPMWISMIAVFGTARGRPRPIAISTGASSSGRMWARLR
jgi:hypothetical protein